MKHPAERVLDDLKAFFCTKNSFGQRELLAAVARLEGEYAREYDDDRYAVLLDRFGGELEEAFRGLMPGPTRGANDPLTEAAASATAMDRTAPPSRDPQGPEGDTHEHHRHPPRPGDARRSERRPPGSRIASAA